MSAYDWYSKRWGRATKDEKELFLLLTVGVFQAGLSWQAAAGKRDIFIRNFANLDIQKVAAFFPEDIENIMADPEMIHNPRKIRAVIANARAIIQLRPEFTSFYEYLWHFSGGESIIETYSEFETIPNTHPFATKVAKDMKKRGFQFVGPILTCMFLKACGIIHDEIH